MNVTSSLFASSLGKFLKISNSPGLSKCASTSLRGLALSSRINACNALSTSRKSRGLGTLSNTASTIALPQSLIVAIELATMKMPSAEPAMMRNSYGCASTSRCPPSAA